MVLATRTFDQQDRAASAEASRQATSLQPDFRRLVGEIGWASLPASVRGRFDAASHRRARRYPGAMAVQMNWLGWLFAQACRLIGSPLAPWPTAEVAVMVEVRPEADGAVLWQRAYAYPGRASLIVASRKEAADGDALFEVTRGGLGMRLGVSVEDGALVFRSNAYFWRLAGARLPIPLLLTPGRATIVHRDLGDGRFHFGLSFIHPLAGETFANAGDFEDPPS